MFFDKKNDEEFYDWESYKAAHNQAEVTEASEENDESENYSLDSHIKTLGVLIIAVLACLTLVFAVKYNQAQKRIKQLEAERFDMIRFFLTVEETDEDEHYWEADDDDFIEKRKNDNFDYGIEPEPRPITPEPPVPPMEETDGDESYWKTDDDDYWEADDDDFIEKHEIDDFDCGIKSEPRSITPEPSVPPVEKPDTSGPDTPEPPVPPTEKPDTSGSDTPEPSVDSHS